MLLTFGDYLYRVPGLLKNVNITIPDEAAWEIAMTEPENGDSDSDVQELPMVLDVSLSFRPVHNFIPETGNKPFLTNPKKKPFN